MRVTIDTDKCSGHARCFAESPTVFDIDDMGFAIQPDELPDAALDDVTRAARACPERAISVQA